MLEVFFSKFMDFNIKQITKEQIEGFIYQLIKENNISESYQNQLINAIKAYYEHVLGMPRAYYNINRPKKSLNIPNILTENEVFKIIQQPKNLKHRAILWTIYSAGLRISELINLRITDIHSDDGYLFVKGGKGKKDRKTILSKYLLPLLRQYYKNYKPAYWLFEGQTGGQYSASSIWKIFDRLKKQYEIGKKGSVHLLRHTFATSLLETGTDIRYIQSLLGHNSLKTTQIYTHVANDKLIRIKSPMDNLDI